MNCVKCRQELVPSCDFLIKLEDGTTKSVDCLTCINMNCDCVGIELYRDSDYPNISYYVNRAIEGLNVADIISSLGLKLDSSLDLTSIIEQLKQENPKQVEMHKSGKKDLIGFFMGRLMKATNNSVDPLTARQSLEKALKE